jgi:PAS domain S-box-containing protein
MTATELNQISLLESLADAILVEDREGQIVFANQRAADLFGFAAETLVGMPYDMLVPEDSRFLLRRHKVYRLKQGRSGVSEPLTGLLARHRDGHQLPIDIRIGLLETPESPLLISSIRCISVPSAAETAVALQTQQQLAQRYLDIAAVMLVVIDADRRVSLINRKGLEILGYTREEQVLGKDWFRHFLPPSQCEPVAGVFEQLIRGEVEPVEYYENPVRRRDGAERLIAWHNRPLYDAAGRITGILSSGQDITERKLAEERLRAQLRLTRAITDCAAESIFLTDAAGRIIMANPEAERLFGYSQSEFKGQVLHDLLHYQHADGRPYPFADCPNCRIYHDGATVRHHEVVFFCKDGASVTVACSNAPLEVDGETSGVVLVAHDISERKVFEQALQEADRRKDEFLAMLAHELRNPLAPILNAAQILSLAGRDESRIRWSQEIIERQVKHLMRLVDELLDVSRIVRGKIKLKQEPLELADILSQAVESVQPSLDHKRQRLLVQLPQQPIRVQGDQVRLIQVLLNGLDNASKYSAEGTSIELDARVQGREVVVRIRDQGEGIPPALLPHVFDPFRQGERSLDRAQGGLGMGLTLVKRLVMLHAGRVEIHSDGVGQGTTLTLCLPLLESQMGRPQRQTAPVRGKAMDVLVVDDEPDVAESTAMLLKAMGHQVRLANSGQDAIDLTRRFEPQMVLLDIGLKGMDGYQTAVVLRQLPNGNSLQLVALSGYGDEQARQRSYQAGFDHHLVKPVTAEQLSQLMGSVAEKRDRRPEAG